MKDQYKIQGPKDKFEVEIEQSVVEKMKKMAKFSKFSEAELANTALKRFIATHKDFLPPENS